MLKKPRKIDILQRIFNIFAVFTIFLYLVVFPVLMYQEIAKSSDLSDFLTCEYKHISQGENVQNSPFCEVDFSLFTNFVLLYWILIIIRKDIVPNWEKIKKTFF